VRHHRMTYWTTDTYTRSNPFVNSEQVTIRNKGVGKW
jgi:hypothetical protein